MNPHAQRVGVSVCRRGLGIHSLCLIVTHKFILSQCINLSVNMLVNMAIFLSIRMSICIYARFFLKYIFNGFFKTWCRGNGTTTTLLEIQTPEEQSLIVKALKQKGSKFKCLRENANSVHLGYWVFQDCDQIYIYTYTSLAEKVARFCYLFCP